VLASKDVTQSDLLYALKAKLVGAVKTQL